MDWYSVKIIYVFIVLEGAWKFQNSVFSLSLSNKTEPAFSNRPTQKIIFNFLVSELFLIYRLWCQDFIVVKSWTEIIRN